MSMDSIIQTGSTVHDDVIQSFIFNAETSIPITNFFLIDSMFIEFELTGPSRIIMLMNASNISSEVGIALVKNNLNHFKKWFRTRKSKEIWLIIRSFADHNIKIFLMESFQAELFRNNPQDYLKLDDKWFFNSQMFLILNKKEIESDSIFAKFKDMPDKVIKEFNNLNIGEQAKVNLIKENLDYLRKFFADCQLGKVWNLIKRFDDYHVRVFLTGIFARNLSIEEDNIDENDYPVFVQTIEEGKLMIENVIIK